jgi:hypothetical protein
MFTRGGSPVLMAHDRDGRHVLHGVTPAMCCSAFETVARLFSMDKDGTPAPAVCSESAAKVILNADRFLHTLPEITVVTRTPVLIERDGELFEITGYDESSGVFAGGDKSEGVGLDQAKEVFDILLRDFRFASPSDRSRAAAAILTPALDRSRSHSIRP